MTRLEFCNVVSHYIGNDDMPIAIRVIQKICEIPVSTVLVILHNVDARRIITPQKHSLQHSPERRNQEVGKLVYAELMNHQNKYSFEGWKVKYRIKNYNFERNFEKL